MQHFYIDLNEKLFKKWYMIDEDEWSRKFTVNSYIDDGFILIIMNTLSKKKKLKINLSEKRK